MQNLNIDNITKSITKLIILIAKYFGKDIAVKLVADITAELDTLESNPATPLPIDFVDAAFEIGDEFIPAITNPAVEAAVEAGANIGQEIADSLLGGAKVSTGKAILDTIKAWFKAKHAAA